MDLVHQNISTIALQPPYYQCPVNINIDKHPRDGYPIHKLEYNNFNYNWKIDSAHPRISKEYETYDKNIKLYEQTKKNINFAAIIFIYSFSSFIAGKITSNMFISNS